jgi:HlyD family secretion protein
MRIARSTPEELVLEEAPWFLTVSLSLFAGALLCLVLADRSEMTTLGAAAVVGMNLVCLGVVWFVARWVRVSFSKTTGRIDYSVRTLAGSAQGSFALAHFVEARPDLLGGEDTSRLVLVFSEAMAAELDPIERARAEKLKAWGLRRASAAEFPVTVYFTSAEHVRQTADAVNAWFRGLDIPRASGGRGARFGLFPLALLALCACTEKSDGALSGYVESELLYIAPQDAGVLAELRVSEGDVVTEGALLFRIDPERMKLQVEQAKSAAAAARARVAEAGPLEEAVAEAQAQYRNAARSYERAAALKMQGVVTQARVDAERAAFETAEARLARAKAERDAAASEAEAAEALAALWEKRLADLSVTAPEAGSVERVYRRAGEMVAAGDPVIALLPPGNLKVRFYAPEPFLSSLQVGGSVTLSCDRCPGAVPATITYIAAEPQFTPPVIYSVDEREKLVFLIEARPETGARLTAGLPVSVQLPQAAASKEEP